MKTSISIITYSYKGKNLRSVLDNINKNTKNEFSAFVIDQHPLRRNNILPESDKFYYRHIFWDFIQSPCMYKAYEIEASKSEYIAIVSDDILLEDGWDEKLIEFIAGRDIVISGSGQRRVIQKDIFQLGVEQFPSDGFNLTQYVDRNFIFGKRDFFINAKYPSDVKYYGEEELLSLRLFRSGVDVWSAPTNTYIDTQSRTIENLYVPYSKYHNYNEAMASIRFTIGQPNEPRTTDQFMEFHRIDFNNLKKIPFQYQDVEYDPNDLAFQQVDARKFAAVTKAIY
jgi:hypothetical protein